MEGILGFYQKEKVWFSVSKWSQYDDRSISKRRDFEILCVWLMFISFCFFKYFQNDRYLTAKISNWHFFCSNDNELFMFMRVCEFCLFEFLFLLFFLVYGFFSIVNREDFNGFFLFEKKCIQLIIMNAIQLS